MICFPRDFKTMLAKQQVEIPKEHFHCKGEFAHNPGSIHFFGTSEVPNAGGRWFFTIPIDPASAWNAAS